MTRPRSPRPLCVVSDLFSYRGAEAPLLAGGATCRCERRRCLPFRGHMVKWYHTRSACGRPWAQSPACPGVRCSSVRPGAAAQMGRPGRPRQPSRPGQHRSGATVRAAPVQSRRAPHVTHRQHRGAVGPASLAPVVPCCVQRLNLGAASLVAWGTWCSGITPAQHAGGPGLNPQCVHYGGGALPSQCVRRWC